MNRFVRFVRAAAQQRRDLLPRRRDRHLVARGGTLLQAVDTNVLTLYIQPWTEAVSKDRRPGYAEVFPEEDEDLVISLGTILAEFLFYRLGGANPLMVLPPLDEEIRAVFAAVVKGAEEETKDATEHYAEIEKVIAQAETYSYDSDYSEAAIELACHADAITRFLEGPRTALHKLRRFTQLLRDTRIVPPEYYLDRHLTEDPVVRTALQPPTDLVDRIKLSQLRDFWLKALHETKNSDTYDKLVERDARVLARLEWINRRFTPPMPGAKPTHRLVLITGDHAIFEAARSYIWHPSKQSFADLFLRHPKAYLAEPGLLSPDEKTEIAPSQNVDTPFDQWLDTWLSKLNPGGNHYEKKLDDLLEKNESEWIDWLAPLASSAPKQLEELRDYWGKYTRNLAINRFPDTRRLEVRAGEERSLLERYKTLVQTDALSKAIHQHIRETWASCFSLVAINSTRLILARSSDSPELIPSRNPPLLMFERFINTCNFIMAVRDKSFISDNDKWNNAIEGIHKDDPSGYALFLALGVLFSAQGIWRVTAILANRALYIATSERPSKISGREAAYLRAVALRRCSRSVEDLAPIDELLSRAERASQSDFDECPGLRGACRFEAERYALYLSYHCYGIFLNQTIPSSIPNLDTIHTDIEKLLVKIECSQERKEIKNYTEHALKIDWFVILFLRSFSEDVQYKLQQANDYYKALKEKIGTKNSYSTKSFYTQMIFKISEWFVEQNLDKKMKLKHIILKELFNNDKIEKYSVMRYDKKLFEKIKNMILSD